MLLINHDVLIIMKMKNLIKYFIIYFNGLLFWISICERVFK